MKYAKDAQTYKVAQQPQDTVQEVTFTKDEQQQIDDVKSLQILLDKNSAYMQDSILMNIDPYQEHVLELQYYIASDYTYNYSKDNKKDYTSAVTNAYVDYAVTGLIKSYREQITTLTSAMTEDQLKVVNNEMEESQDDESANADVTVSAPVLSKKYIVLGFVMGAFLAALYLVCMAVLSNKLQEAEKLVRFYKLRQFGVLTQGKGAKGLTGFLLRLKYRNQKILTEEASVQLAVSNIELYCKNENITKLFLTGSEIERVDKRIITGMVDSLNKKGVQVVYGENICYDAAAMREASEAGHVVLVETTNASIYQEIEKELRMLKDWNVDVE